MRMINVKRNVIAILIYSVVFPVGSQACSLAFLQPESFGAVTVDGTINGSEWDDAASAGSGGDPCVGQLLDIHAHSSPEPYDPANNQYRDVTVYTKRDSSNFYIALNIEDHTLPFLLGEEVVVYIDPDNSRDAAPQGGSGSSADYRYSGTFVRGAGDVYEEDWSVGNGSAWVDQAKPVGVVASASNQGGTRYHVEMKIPFSAIGYSLSDGDLGMALAVINDLNATDSGFNVLSALAFPDDDAHLPVNVSSDPLDEGAGGSNWNNPSHWGEAFTTGAGDTIYFSHDPAFWKSEDIVTAFCNDRSFGDVAAGGRSTSNDLWYQYDADNVCEPLYTAAKLRREGALVGVEQRRVLFLWGEPAMGVREWYYMGHTDPIALDPSASPSGAGHIYEITDYVDWDGIPAGLSGHPCVLAIALPKNLHPQDVADFAEYADNDTRDLVNKDDILNRYDITGRNNQAQMNIITVDEDEEFTCPACGIGREGRHDERNFAKRDITDFLFAQVSSDSRDYPSVKIPPKRDRKPDQKLTDAVFDLTGYGIAVNSGKKDYVYVEELGGIQVVANLDYVAGQKGVDVPVKLVNPTDSTMRVFVDVKQVTPVEETRIGLNFDMPGRILKPGQSMVLETRVAKTTGDNGPGDDDKPGEDCKPSYCKKCPHKSPDTMAGHAAFLFAGLGGLGLFGYRRKKRKQ